MFFKKRQRSEEHISRREPGFEEGERRTPKTGIVLLLLMFVAGLFFGWRAVDDLARVPTQPEPLSFCSDAYRPAGIYQRFVTPIRQPEAFKTAPLAPFDSSVSFELGCQWSQLEQEAGIPVLYERRRTLEKNIAASVTEQQDLDRAISKRQQLESQYNLRLQELQAGVKIPTSAELSALQEQVNAAQQEEFRLRAVVDQKVQEARTNSSELKGIDQQLTTAYQPVFEEQEQRVRWYEFLVFVLQLIFVLPLFLIALSIYLKQLRKNSPYAVIATAIVAVAGVLLLRVILVWFWDLFLAQVIETLWRWIQNFQLLRSLVFYLGMILSFVIFGGAVYYLQKKIFDPRRVAIRRFRQKQCPQCQTSLDLAEMFCPNCGHHIREACASCGKPRFVGMPHCPHCGK